MKSLITRAVLYWLTTVLLAFELGLGGVWDVLRLPHVRLMMERLDTRPISFSSWGSGNSSAPLHCSFLVIPG